MSGKNGFCECTYQSAQQIHCDARRTVSAHMVNPLLSQPRAARPVDDQDVQPPSQYIGVDRVVDVDARPEAWSSLWACTPVVVRRATGPMGHRIEGEQSFKSGQYSGRIDKFRAETINSNPGPHSRRRLPVRSDRGHGTARRPAPKSVSKNSIAAFSGRWLITTESASPCSFRCSTSRVSIGMP